MSMDWAWTEDSSGNPMLKASNAAYIFLPMGDEIGLFSACCTYPVNLYPYNALEEYELEDKPRDWVCGKCKRILFSLPMGVGTEIGAKHLTAWLTLLVNATTDNELMGEIEISILEELIRPKLEA